MGPSGCVIKKNPPVASKAMSNSGDLMISLASGRRPPGIKSPLMFPQGRMYMDDFRRNEHNYELLRRNTIVISTINHSYWSYVAPNWTLSFFFTGATHCSYSMFNRPTQLRLVHTWLCPYGYDIHLLFRQLKMKPVGSWYLLDSSYT